MLLASCMFPALILMYVISFFLINTIQKKKFKNNLLQGEFVDGGTETHFTIEDAPAYIRVTSSSDRKTGLVYDLIYKDKMVSQEKEVYQ